MQPLLDADVCVYEVGFAAETAWKGENPGIDIQEFPPPFDMCATLLDNRIANICAIVGASQPPILFLTGKTNFRFAIAKRTPYKARAGNKPYHYKNILAYIKGKYEYRIVEGFEADDLMSLEQTRVERLLDDPDTDMFLANPVRTIICTRDKDLRAVPGMHFGWELGMQPQFGPEEVSRIGYITLSADRKKVKGTGALFFFSQCLTGDLVDSIPGLPKCGPVAAYAILEGSQTEEEAFRRTLAAYTGLFGDRAEEELLEQGRLLHMTRELHEDGTPILWELLH